MDTYEYWLTIVTSRVYTQERFVKEAQRIGVNRSVPQDILRSMAWNEPVLVADWTSGAGMRRIVVKSKWKHKKNSVIAPPGNIRVFGYFTVDSVIPQGFTPEAHAEFTQGLDIAAEVPAEGSVERACGSYSLSGGYIVKDTVLEVVENAAAVAKKHKLDLKWFVGGHFYSIPEIDAGEAKWTLGFRKAVVDVQIESGGVSPRAVKFVEKYARRRHLKKIDADRMDGVQAGLA